MPYPQLGLQGILGKSRAVSYLNDYLGPLGPTVILHEWPYVDRHYLDEFANYYATSFAAPSPHCDRFHFFSGITEEALNGRFDRIYAESDAETRRKSEAELSANHYLGFVIKRPLPGATLGRSVLKTYPIEGRRNYAVLRPYRVNLAGLRLEVEGLAYQQQDGGAAVCASTALWSALQQVAHMAGHRTPTPYAITKAAGSPFPASHGLDYVQMASAIKTLGYIADQFVPGRNWPLFRAKLVSSLRSHLPVILFLLRTEDGGEPANAHAVTLTGYSECEQIVNVTASSRHAPLRMRAGSLKTIYVHDDNLGSHAHYELDDGADPKNSLMLVRGRSDKPQPAWLGEWLRDWRVECALVPKPSKLRMPVESLIGATAEISYALANACPGMDLDYHARFDSGVQYKSSLFDMGLDPAEFRTFQERLSLPRQIGVVSAYANEGTIHVYDALIDVTEIRAEPSLLAVVAPGIEARSQAQKLLEQICATAKCSRITAARTNA